MIYFFDIFPFSLYNVHIIGGILFMGKNTSTEIQELAKNIDIKKASEEMLNWLIDNVENYIDNKETVFSLYFPVDKVKLQNMDQIFNLGSLYQNFENEKIKEERECIKGLDDVVELVKKEMMGDKILLEKLFKRLVYYYEMIGFSVKSGPVIQDMDGYIIVKKFFYEPIGMDLTVTKKYNKMSEDGTLVASDKQSEIVKKEHIPEGFVVEIEIKKWAKQKIVSMF